MSELIPDIKTIEGIKIQMRKSLKRFRVIFLSACIDEFVQGLLSVLSAHVQFNPQGDADDLPLFQVTRYPFFSIDELNS
jgi:hypothetical protein